MVSTFVFCGFMHAKVFFGRRCKVFHFFRPQNQCTEPAPSLITSKVAVFEQCGFFVVSLILFFLVTNHLVLSRKRGKIPRIIFCGSSVCQAWWAQIAQSLVKGLADVKNLAR